MTATLGDDERRTADDVVASGRLTAAWTAPAAVPTFGDRHAQCDVGQSDEAIVAVLAVAASHAWPPRLDVSAALGRLAAGDDVSLVAEELRTYHDGRAVPGLLTARLEPGMLRLATSGTGLGVRLGDGRRQPRDLGGDSTELAVRAISAGFDEGAVLVLHAGPHHLPPAASPGPSATCAAYVSALVAACGSDDHAIVVARAALGIS